MPQFIQNSRSFHFDVTFIEAFHALLMQLNELFLLDLDDFCVLFQIVFEWKNEVDVKCFQLLRNETKEREVDEW